MSTKRTTQKKSSVSSKQSYTPASAKKVKRSLQTYVSTANTVHVVPREKDGWAVTSEGASRAAKVVKNKASAVSYGKDLARKRSGNLVVHKKDGTFASRIKPKTPKATAGSSKKRK